MQIFQLRVPLKFSGRDLLLDGVQSLVDLVVIVRRNETGLRERSRMRDRAGHFVSIQTLIERNGLAALPRQLRGRLVESSLAHDSADRGRPTYGDRDKFCVGQNEFAQFHDDSLHGKTFQQMRGETIGQGFNKLVGMIAHKRLCRVAYLGLTDGVLELVAKIDEGMTRPDGDGNGHTLRDGALSFGDTNARQKFELLDVNKI